MSDTFHAAGAASAASPARDAVRLAAGTLTTWRVHPPTRVDDVVAGRAMLLAPVVVAPAALAVTVFLTVVAATGRPGGVAAALVVAALALSTRGMHLDGLADLADGLCAGFDRERSLAVMKRSDTGAGGVAAVVVVLLVQYAGIAALTTDLWGAAAVGVLVLVSRHMLAWACRRPIPAATVGGLGATVAGTVATRWAVTAAVPLLALAVAVASLDSTLLRLPAASVVALLAGHGVVGIARRRLGGITGDVLGAAVEVTLATGLAAAALLPG